MGFLNEIFGDKPSVPELEKLNPGVVQQNAIENNLAAMPKAQDLVSRANLFSREEIDKMLAAAGGQNLLGDAAGQISKMIAGELPLSDVQQSHLKSVAKSFGTGTAGSGAMGNLVARDLGLRELDVISKGLSSAESWLRTTASLYEPSMLNLSTMFLTPTQQYQMENEQNLQQFQQQWMGEQIDAMPDPVLRGALLDMPMNLISAVRGSAPNPAFSGNNYSGIGGGGWDDAPGMDYADPSIDIAGEGMDFAG